MDACIVRKVLRMMIYMAMRREGWLHAHKRIMVEPRPITTLREGARPHGRPAIAR